MTPEKDTLKTPEEPSMDPKTPSKRPPKWTPNRSKTSPGGFPKTVWRQDPPRPLPDPLWGSILDPPDPIPESILEPRDPILESIVAPFCFPSRIVSVSSRHPKTITKRRKTTPESPSRPPSPSYYPQHPSQPLPPTHHKKPLAIHEGSSKKRGAAVHRRRRLRYDSRYGRRLAVSGRRKDV